MRGNLVSYINAWGTRAQEVSLVGGKRKMSHWATGIVNSQISMKYIISIYYGPQQNSLFKYENVAFSESNFQVFFNNIS